MIPAAIVAIMNGPLPIPGTMPLMMEVCVIIANASMTNVQRRDPFAIYHVMPTDSLVLLAVAFEPGPQLVGHRPVGRDAGEQAVPDEPAVEVEELPGQIARQLLVLGEQPVEPVPGTWPRGQAVDEDDRGAPTAPR